MTIHAALPQGEKIPQELLLPAGNLRLRALQILAFTLAADKSGQLVALRFGDEADI